MNISPDVITFVVKLFCLSTMFAMGLSTSLDDVLNPFRNKLALAIIVLVNNVLLPLIGLVIVALTGSIAKISFLQPIVEDIALLPDGQLTGMLLLLMASGSLLAPLLARLSGASVDLSRGIMIVSGAITTLTMPLVAAFINWFGSESMPKLPEFLEIFGVLLTYQLIPLALGLLLNHKYTVIAKQLKPLVVQVTTLSFVALVAILVFKEATTQDLTTEMSTRLRALGEQIMNPVGFASIGASLLDLLSGTIARLVPYVLFGVLAVALSFGGNLTGKIVRNMVDVGTPDCPRVVAISTAVRNVSAALIVAAEHLSLQDGTLGFILLFYVFSLIVAGVQVNGWAQEA